VPKGACAVLGLTPKSSLISHTPHGAAAVNIQLVVPGQRATEDLADDPKPRDVTPRKIEVAPRPPQRLAFGEAEEGRMDGLSQKSAFLATTAGLQETPDFIGWQISL